MNELEQQIVENRKLIQNRIEGIGYPNRLSLLPNTAFIKGKPAPVGEIRTWKDGQKMIKTGEGWKPHQEKKKEKKKEDKKLTTKETTKKPNDNKKLHPEAKKNLESHAKKASHISLINYLHQGTDAIVKEIAVNALKQKLKL